jgi:hypothetical protein
MFSSEASPLPRLGVPGDVPSSFFETSANNAVRLLSVRFCNSGVEISFKFFLALLLARTSGVFMTRRESRNAPAAVNELHGSS